MMRKTSGINDILGHGRHARHLHLTVSDCLDCEKPRGLSPTMIRAYIIPRESINGIIVYKTTLRTPERLCLLCQNRGILKYLSKSAHGTTDRGNG